MALTKILDVESVRFAAPDLDRMREFLLDFGLSESEGTNDGVLRMPPAPALARIVVPWDVLSSISGGRGAT